jgi:hypothetical protein
MPPASRPPALSPRLQRLERLLRTAIADPAFFHADTREAALAHAAQAQPFIVTDALLDQLRGRFAAHFAGGFGQAVGRATEIRAGLTHLDASIDLACLTTRGSWNLVNISLIETDEEVELQRMRATATLVDRFGLAPVEKRWLLRLAEPDAGGGLKQV